MCEPSKYQKAIYEAFQNTDDNLNISAVAGSGKTTVLLKLLEFVPKGKSCLFLAFNKSIVEELKSRVERDDVKIMTIHSAGWRSVLRRYGSDAKLKTSKAVAKVEMAMKHFDVPKKRYGYYFYSMPVLMDMMRCNLCENTREDILRMINHYDINLYDERDIEIAKYIFNQMIADRKYYDFMDMIYVPLIDATIRLQKYDYVFCDESQDFSIMQQDFIKNCLTRKGRLVTVGDPRQAIYGFAGSDANSYQRLADINGPSRTMPLSVSYRCAKNIVLEAQNIVPEIDYNEGATEGVVRQGSLTDIKMGDWVICRNVRPLVEAYFWFTKNRIKSTILGNDIGAGILQLINRTGAKTIHTMNKRLEEEKSKLYDKLSESGVAKPLLHPKMEALQGKIDVIDCLSDESNDVEDLKRLINEIFSDEVEGIQLCTIHKSKGLENDRIFILAPELIPSKYAIQDWQLEQERNLMYVAITRAKKELVYVASSQFDKDRQGKLVI